MQQQNLAREDGTVPVTKQHRMRIKVAVLAASWDAIVVQNMAYSSHKFNLKTLLVFFLPSNICKTPKRKFFCHILTIEFWPSILLAVLSVAAFMVVHTLSTTPKTATTITYTNTRTNTPTSTIRPAGTGSINQTGHVAYSGSLHVTSDDFVDTLLDQDSLDYQEREHKYGRMVSWTPYRIFCELIFMESCVIFGIACKSRTNQDFFCVTLYLDQCHLQEEPVERCLHRDRNNWVQLRKSCRLFWGILWQKVSKPLCNL